MKMRLGTRRRLEKLKEAESLPPTVIRREYSPEKWKLRRKNMPRTEKDEEGQIGLGFHMNLRRREWENRNGCDLKEKR